MSRWSPARGRPWLLVVAFGCALYGLFLAANTVHAVGGSDSSGYINAARMLARGQPVAPVPGLRELGLELGWRDQLVPLGLADGPEPDTMVPYYPPGYPLLIAASATIFGWQTGPFLVPGIFGALGLFLLYLLGRDLGLPPVYAAGAAVVLGAWPVYVWGGIQLMSDTVAAAWSIGAVLLATVARRRDSDAAAAGCGAVFVFSVLIRPANVILAPALAVMLLPSPRRIGSFLLGGLPVGVPWLLYNQALYGGPLTTGYSGHLWSDLDLAYFPERFPYYLYWIGAMLPLPLLGWLSLPGARRWKARSRLLIWTWFLAYLLFYSCYHHHGSWWYVRFLAPAVPAVILGGAMALRAFQERGDAGWRPAVAVLAVLLTVGVAAVQGDRVDLFPSVRAQRNFVTGASWVQELGPRTIVASYQFSGALHYYTDAIPVRWERFSPEQFDRLRRRTEQEGWRWYAMLEAWEAPELPRHMPGDWSQVTGARGISLWRLPPMTPAERARLDREGVRRVQAALETLEATPRRERLRRQVRRAFRLLRSERYRRARPLLQRLSRVLSRAPDGPEVETGRRILAAWQALLPEPER